jgi:putative endonuclease
MDAGRQDGWGVSFPKCLIGNPEKQMKQYYVYILTSKRNGTLYTGMTSDLIQRAYQHRQNLADGFTKKYGVHLLV